MCAGLLLAAAVAALSATAHGANITPQQLLSQMSLQQKIGQMTQLNIDQVLVDGSYYNLDPVKLQKVFGQYGVGSVINTPFANGCPSGVTEGWSVEQWRGIISGLQAAAMANQSITPPIPMLFGLDSVHGANYVSNAALFPHNTGAAATFNPSLYRLQAAITATDTRTAGIPWMFSPVLGLGMNPLWSRIYETLGSDPFVGATFATAYIQGAMGAAAVLNYTGTPAFACMKHYFGYSNPRSGKDRTDAWIPFQYLKQYFQPAFAAAVAAGVRTAMINSASINGVPAHASKPLLTDILRTELNFTGVAVTDWLDIIKLYQYHGLAANNAEAILLALNAGVDMSMVPEDFSFPDTLLQLVQNGSIPESRLDESVTRILQLKIDMGLFEDPVVPPGLANRVVGGPADQAAALASAREAITLLSNAPAAGTGGKPILPLTGWLPQGANILVTGPASVDAVALCGGWTLSWLGAGSCNSFPPGTASSIAEGVSYMAGNASGKGWSVTSFMGASFSTANASDLATVTALSKKAAVVVMAVGEPPESETPGDTQALDLSAAQYELYQAVLASGTPFVTVLVEPRPRVISSIATDSAALIMAYLPCVKGGQAIAETLFGVNNPSGRLPYDYPATTGDLDVHFHKPCDSDPAGAQCDHQPLYPFGHGLSLSTLSYGAPTLSATAVPAGAVVNVSVPITNTGNLDALESVLVYVRQLNRAAITPEARLLKGFTKIAIPAGATVTATVSVDTHDFAYWTPDLDRAIDAGVYNLTVGMATPTATGAAGTTLQLTLTSSGVYTWSRALGWALEQGEQGRDRAGATGVTLLDAVLSELQAAGGVGGAGSPVARAVRQAQVRERLAPYLQDL